MHLIRSKTGAYGRRGLASLSLIALFLMSNCATSPAAGPATGATPAGASAKLAVTFDGAWKLGQDNSVDVRVTDIGDATILAVELIPPEAPDATGTQPAGDRGEQMRGVVVVYRVCRNVPRARITFPAALFDPAQYATGADGAGWELKLVLASEIHAYPVLPDGSLGEVYRIIAKQVPAQQTWVQSQAGVQAPAGPPSEAVIAVPDSAAGAFFYYPRDAVVDMLVLASGADFQFREAK